MRTILAVALSLAAAASPAAAAGLAGAPRLAAAYDRILDAQFDRAADELAAACPPAPREACQALGVASMWWQIQIDPATTALDPPFTAAAEASIAASQAWTVREPQRAEAWFYLAGSYAPLVQWRVFRGQRLAAARDGNRIRVALEHALMLDPGLEDAYFGIGLYHYYADVASAGAKLLRMLLFLPGGDRARGLREMIEARDKGELLRGEADYQMHWLYAWYEHDPDKAIALLRGLDERHPFNPIFLQRIAEIERDSRKDTRASMSAWQQLLDRALANRVARASLIEARARRALSFH